MLGYCLQREPEELFYSVVARMRHMLFPDRAFRYAAFRMFGSYHRTAGGVLPNNARHFLDRLGPLAPISEDDVLEGSTYHLVAPLLTASGAEKLRASLFGNGDTGSRNWFANNYFRYCPQCSIEDRKNERPQCWRILHNYPGITCCERHQIRLRTSVIKPSTKDVFIAEGQMECDGPLVRASLIELEVARDIKWLKSQRSVNCPGWPALVAAIRHILNRDSKYYQYGWLRPAQIREDLFRAYGDAVTLIDPQLANPRSDRSVHFWRNPPPVRLSMLAQLVGTSLAEVFALSKKDEVVGKCAPVFEAIRRVTAAVAQYPLASRSEIHRKCTYHYDFLRKNKPEQLEKILPPARIRNGHDLVDWEDRDEDLSRQVASLFTREAGRQATKSDIIRALGRSYGFFYANQHRLPKTHSAINHFAVREWRSRQKMEPVQHLANEKRQHIRDWPRRDLEFVERLKRELPNMPYSAKRNVASLLRYLGENDSLLSYSNGRLPEFSRFIKEIVLPGAKADRIQELRAKITALRQKHPTADRSTISRYLPAETAALRLISRAHYEEIMPPSVQGKREADWEARDDEMTKTLEEKGALAPLLKRRTVPTLLKFLGYPSHMIITAKGRLPRAMAAARKLIIVEWEEALIAEKIKRLEALVAANSNLGRDQIRLLDRALTESLKAKSPDEYERIMPKLLRNTAVGGR